MSNLDATRAELALLVLYLKKAIQYGSKFVSNGELGTSQNVDKSTSLARKVFRPFKLAELGRLSSSMKKSEKELKNTDKYENEQYRAKLKQSNGRTLALVKAAMDIVIAVGLLQLAPKKVTPRVTRGLGFISSLISCCQKQKQTLAKQLNLRLRQVEMWFQNRRARTKLKKC